MSDEQSTLAEASRTWGTGWRRYFFPAFWLVYLGQAVDGVSKHSTGAAAVVGYVIVAAFAAVLPHRAAARLGSDAAGDGCSGRCTPRRSR